MHTSSLAKLLFLMSFPVILTAACKGGKMSDKVIPLTTVTDISDSTWKKLSEKRIYFGHQSVGFNIVEGVKDAIKENPRIDLQILETSDQAMFEKPIFAHSRNGKNHDPKSKIDNFVFSMDHGIGNKADFAFFKFCFVDISANTDVKEVFAYYSEKMKELKYHYPKTTFIHATVPLTTVQGGTKAFIKKILGRTIDGYADNGKRNEFNDLLRKEYGEKAPIFDLAKLESVTLDGGYVTFTKEGKSFFAMNPEFTNDGGHLNETGRKFIARSLLITMARLIEYQH
jgi:hypothetical protein